MKSALNCTTQRPDSLDSRPYSNAEYNAMMDAAKARAVQLRHEAVQEFWQFTGDVACHGLRSAQRLAYRLARRARHLTGAQTTPFNIEA